jgi:hypothetical protein
MLYEVYCHVGAISYNNALNVIDLMGCQIPLVSVKLEAR